MRRLLDRVDDVVAAEARGATLPRRERARRGPSWRETGRPSRARPAATGSAGAGRPRSVLARPAGTSAGRPGARATPAPASCAARRGACPAPRRTAGGRGRGSSRRLAVAVDPGGEGHEAGGPRSRPPSPRLRCSGAAGSRRWRRRSAAAGPRGRRSPSGRSGRGRASPRARATGPRRSIRSSTTIVAGTEFHSPRPRRGPPGHSGMSGRWLTKSSTQWPTARTASTSASRGTALPPEVDRAERRAPRRDGHQAVREGIVVEAQRREGGVAGGDRGRLHAGEEQPGPDEVGQLRGGEERAERGARRDPLRRVGRREVTEEQDRLSGSGSARRRSRPCSRCPPR